MCHKLYHFIWGIWWFHRSKDFEATKAGKLAIWSKSSPNLNSCSIKFFHRGTFLCWLVGSTAWRFLMHHDFCTFLQSLQSASNYQLRYVRNCKTRSRQFLSLFAISLHLQNDSANQFWYIHTHEKKIYLEVEPF